MIVRLVRMLKHGAVAKQAADVAIDLCGRIHNIRTSILQSLDKVTDSAFNRISPSL